MSKTDFPTTRVPGPPDVWACLTTDPSDERLAEAAAEEKAWMQSPAGALYLEWDRRVCEHAKTHHTDYRAAMEALNVEFT